MLRCSSFPKQGSLALDRELLAWFRQNEVARRLETIPGLGVVVATAFAATVTDPQRFRSGRQFAAWLGLTPLANSSGGKERMGRISKMGDPYLRRLMVVGVQLQAEKTAAALIWSRLDFEGADRGISDASLRGLWELATTTKAIRKAFLRQIAVDRYQVETLTSALASIMRALGLRPKADLVQRLLSPILDEVIQIGVDYHLAASIKSLRPYLTPAQAFDTLAASLKSVRHSEHVPEYRKAMARLIESRGANPNQAWAGLGPVADTLASTSHSDQSKHLSRALHALGPSPEQAQAALEDLVVLSPRQEASRTEWHSRLSRY